MWQALRKYSAELLTELNRLPAGLFVDANKDNPVKPLVLTPGRLSRECCGRRVVVGNRPSFPLVYTTQGTRVAAVYHGSCHNCGTSYYPSHAYNAGEGTETFLDLKTIEYLQVTSATVFEIEYLRQVTNTLSLCNATFESVADLYNANHGPADDMLMEQLTTLAGGRAEHPWTLNRQRLEESWFLYQVILYWQGRNCFDVNYHTEKDVGNRRNMEELCRRVMIQVTVTVPKWLNHECNTKGCREGYATLDGNEKIKRSMCAAPKDKVELPAGGVSIMQCCPQTPLHGGKHAKPSKYCPVHQYLEDVSGDGPRPAVLDDTDNLQLKKIPQSEVGSDLPSNDCTIQDGCKKDCNITRYYDRTAGIAALVRPCGIILNVCEMYTCESMTQMYLFLVLTVGHGNLIKRLRYLGYDRACGLEPFLKNLSAKKVYFAKYLLRNMKFLVDKFHCEKHTEPCCMPLSNPLCKYHPDLPFFSEIRGANTECAEQAFRWLNRFKTSVRSMSRYRFNVFLHVMVDCHNHRRHSQLSGATM